MWIKLSAAFFFVAVALTVVNGDVAEGFRQTMASSWLLRLTVATLLFSAALSLLLRRRR
jgi:hypothetical protein